MKRRVAVRIPNWLGDAVMARPAVAAVAAGGDEPVVAGKPAFAGLFSDYAFVSLGGSWDHEPLRTSGCERIILLTNSFSTAFAARRAGIAERVGFRRYGRSFLLTLSPGYPRGIHQIDRYLRLAGEAGYGVVDREPRLPIPPESAIPRPYLVLAPGARYGSAKRWTGYVALCRRLTEGGMRVVVLGLREECEGLCFTRHENLLDMTGATTLPELLSILRGASGVVSNDSGIAHCARALGCRTLVIFGPTDSAATLAPGAAALASSAPCAPCHLRVCPIDHRCMNSISVDTVETVVRNGFP